MAKVKGETVEYAGKATLDTSEVKRGANEIEQDMERIGKRGEESGSKVGKAFEAANSILGGLLPRNLQSLTRKFQSTVRAVKRAGVSFKGLRTAIASTGIGLLVVGLGLLIENFEKVTDWLGITSEEMRRTAQRTKELNQEIQDLEISTQRYVEVLENTQLSLEMRQEALKVLAQRSAILKGLDLEHADALNEVAYAMELLRLQTEKQKRMEFLDEDIKRLQETIDLNEKALEGWWKGADGGNSKRKEIEEAEAQLLAIQEERGQITSDLLEIEATYTRYTEDLRKEQERLAQAERDRLEAEREAERLAQEREKERERRRQKDLELVARTEKAEEQLGMTREELALDELDRREKEELKTATSEKAKAAVRKYYAMEYRRIIDEFQKEADEFLVQEEERINKAEELFMKSLLSMEEARMQLQDDLYLTAEEKRDQERTKLAQDFDERMAIAEGNADLELQVREQYLKELAELEQKFRDEDIKSEQDRQAAKIAAVSAGVGKVGSLLGDVSGMMAEGSAQAKQLAIADILIQQAVSMANAIAGATKAANATGPAAPFTMAGYIASMLGTVIGGYKQINALMNTPAPSVGGFGRGGGGRTPQALVPNMGYDPEANAQQNMNISAYVVQSDLQGQGLHFSRQLGRATL